MEKPEQEKAKQGLHAQGLLSKLLNIEALGSTKVSLMKDSVFNNLCRVSKPRECSATLILALRSFFYPSTRTFDFNSNTTLKLCPKEVALVLGMEDQGKDFNLMDKLELGGKKKGNYLDGREIRNMLDKMSVEDEESKILFKKLCIYYIIDKFIFASKAKPTRVRLWSLVDDLENVETYNWPKATLDFIFEQLATIQAEEVALLKEQTIGSAIQVLEIVLFERIEKTQPKVVPNKPLLLKYESSRKTYSQWKDILENLKPEDIQSCIYCAGTSASIASIEEVSEDMENLSMRNNVEGDMEPIARRTRGGLLRLKIEEEENIEEKEKECRTPTTDPVSPLYISSTDKDCRTPTTGPASPFYISSTDKECRTPTTDPVSPVYISSTDSMAAMGMGKRLEEPVVLLDVEEFEPDETAQEDHGEREMNDSGYIEIHYSDLKCLAPEAFISSKIMTFYIRCLQEKWPPSKTTGEVGGPDCHLFESFFYEKLKDIVAKKKVDEESFAKLRRWWKNVNIFQKAYIFLPICENYHWSLVIVCMPDKEDHSELKLLHLDSFGYHNSIPIFSNIKSFLEEEWRLVKEGKDAYDVPFAKSVS